MMAVKKTTALTAEEHLEKALVPADEQPYEVPENWCWLSLDLITEILNGYAFKSALYSATGIRIIRITNVQDGYIEDEKPVFYPYETKPDIEQYILKNNDLLMSLTGNVGRVALMKDDYLPAALNQRVACLRLKLPEVNIQYLFYYFLQKNFMDDCIKASKGSAQLNMSTEWLKRYPIALPPIEEQKRIVDRIESLFAKFDEAKAKLEDALSRFETRKAAILYQAFNGELTEQWRKNNGTPFQWTDGVLLDVLKEKPRNGYSPHPVTYPTKYKSMTLSATTSGVFEPKHYKYIDEEIPEDSYLWMKPGDILIQRANSLEKVGTSAIYTGGYHEFIYPDLMMKLQVRDGVSAEFIAYQLKSETVMTYFRSNATGTAGNMPKINQQTVSSVPVKIPPLEEQREIVRILDAFFAKENAVRKTIEERLAKIELYKKSVLAKAFRGELGTNDQSDQPATELLKQILA